MRLGRALAALAVILVVFGVGLGWLWRRVFVRPLSRVEVVQTVSPGWSAPLQAGLQDLLHTHTELEVTVRFASSAAPSTGADTLGADVWLGPKVDGVGGVAMMDFPILAFRRDLVKRAPESWADVADVALEVNAAHQLPYGIALPENEQLLGGVLGVRGSNGELQPTPEGIDLVTQLRGQYRLATVGCSSECALNLLVNGRSPFAVMNTRNLVELEARLGELLGVTALPTLPGEVGSHHVYASALVVQRGNPGANSRARAEAIATVAKGLEQVVARQGFTLHVAPTSSADGPALSREGILGDNDRALQRIGREQTELGSPAGQLALATAARRIFH